MLGFGGRYYWARKDGGGKGIVLAFAWMCSEDKHLKNYVRLYSSLGWDSLVCHAGCLNMFASSQATSLAFDVLDELVKELKSRPCPVVLAPFSGGPKACMYKLLQIIEGNCEAHHFQDGYRLVKECISGYIYDSSPVDFYSELAFSFFVHPSVTGGQPPKILSWTAQGIRVCIDAFTLSRYEAERADYWQTLYASASMGAPYLILCSVKDDLATYQTVRNFAQRLQELGADVKFVNWGSSPHVGHYRMHPVEYRTAVTDLLEKAFSIYSQRFKQLKGDRMAMDDTHNEIPGPIHYARAAAESSGERFHALGLEPNNQFVLPSSMEQHGGMHIGSMQGDDAGRCIRLPNTPTPDASGVQKDILFDEVVPKNVEEWDVTDVKPSDSLNDLPSASHQRNAPCRYTGRSRL